MSPEPRQIDLDALVLLKGSHKSFAEGACVMEVVSYVAGEKFSDSPKCASPVIASFLRRWNDDLDDAGRQRLRPLIPRLVGSAATKAIENKRAWLAADWLVRVHTPAWLRLAKMEEQAVALESLPPLTSAVVASGAQPTINAAREKAATARAAAWAASGAAAWAAARAAAWAASGATSGATAGAAARATAGAAARATARDAAWDAAWAAAWAALKPTVLSLQDSAMDLVDRMLTVTE